MTKFLREQYSSDFILVRRAIFMNFISHSAPISEEDLTPEDIVVIIQDVGKEYIGASKRGISEIK